MIAVDRELGDNSELKELWKDSNDFDAWVKEENDIRSELKNG